MRQGTGDKGQAARGFALLILVACLLSPVPSAAQHRPGLNRPVRPIRAAAVLPPALRRALQASDTLRFSGRRTVTLMKDGQPNRHEEIVMRDGPQIRIEFPREGPYSGQVIVENGDDRRHYIPRTNEVRVEAAKREEGLQHLRQLARDGRVTTEPGGRVAGYDTTTVVVRDAAGNPLQRLAIEPESGMVLTRQVYDATGVQVGGFEFTSVNLSPASFDSSLFRIERKGVQTTTFWDKLQTLATRNGYRAVGLPESTGFQLDGVNFNRKLIASGVLVQNYTGPGGGRLSLFQLREAVDPTSLRNKGGRRLLHSLSWTDGGITFVLLGPQDDATLARLKGAIGR